MTRQYVQCSSVCICFYRTKVNVHQYDAAFITQSKLSKTLQYLFCQLKMNGSTQGCTDNYRGVNITTLLVTGSFLVFITLTFNELCRLIKLK